MDLKYFWAMKSLGWVVSVRCARQPGAPLPLAKDETFINFDILPNVCYARVHPYLATVSSSRHSMPAPRRETNRRNFAFWLDIAGRTSYA